MDIKKILGKRIQENRKAKNITQEKMAEIIGIDTISLSKIETGRNYPTAENLTKIAEILEIDVYELFINNNLKSNEELLDEIYNNLNKIKNDSKKLYIVNSTLKSVILI